MSAKWTRTPRSVDIVLWDGVELLDFAGPGQVFGCAGDGHAFAVRTVAARPGPVRSQGFLDVTPEGVIGDGRAPDVLVVPGGSSETAVADRELVQAVAREGERAGIVLSVCTGALVLAAAGLLDGSRADGEPLRVTTWHGALDRLREAAPDAVVSGDRRWIDNGHVVTAAGVSAGIDAALHLVERLLGDEVRRDTESYMEYVPGGRGPSKGGSS